MTTPSPGIMNHLPRDASFGARRVDDLERKVREGLAARAAEATSIANGATLLRDSEDLQTLVSLGTDPETAEPGVNLHNGGNVNVNDGGSIRVRDGGTTIVSDRGNIAVFDHDGEQIAQIGGIGALPTDTGVGIVFFMPGGGVAMQYIDGDLVFFDRTGHVILRADPVTGRGLSDPTLESGGFRNTNVGTWQSTTSTTWTTVGSMYFKIINPRVTWQIQGFCSTAAQMRIVVAGSVLTSDDGVSEFAVTPSFPTWSANAALPSGVNIGDVPLIELQARITGAAATAYVNDLRFSGQSG